MKVLILYSTIYGHNLETGCFIRHHFFQKADWSSIAQFDSAMLADYDLLVICPSTYGEGYLQPQDENFAGFLKGHHFPHLNFLVIGAGDRNFGHASFANAANIFFYLLKHSGAHPLHAVIKYDFANLLTAEDGLEQLLTRNQLLGSINNEKSAAH